MAWRRRMGERQPDMERHEPRLRSRAEQSKAKDEARADGRYFMRANCFERIASFWAGEQAGGRWRAVMALTRNFRQTRWP
jgi:hypothetical protein